LIPKIVRNFFWTHMRPVRPLGGALDMMYWKCAVYLPIGCISSRSQAISFRPIT